MLRFAVQETRRVRPVAASLAVSSPSIRSPCALALYSRISLALPLRPLAVKANLPPSRLASKRSVCPPFMERLPCSSLEGLPYEKRPVGWAFRVVYLHVPLAVDVGGHYPEIDGRFRHPYRAVGLPVPHVVHVRDYPRAGLKLGKQLGYHLQVGAGKQKEGDDRRVLQVHLEDIGFEKNGALGQARFPRPAAAFRDKGGVESTPTALAWKSRAAAITMRPSPEPRS